ncbi:IS3 family transposase [Streptomyces sp. tea 10]|nr:IS3 family transposase [Streptomyces sp. tea 10]
MSFAGRTRSCDRPRFFRSGARPPTEMIVTFIDQHKHEFGVEPICRTLTAAGTQIAPSTYDAFTSRPPSKRALRDEELLVGIRRVHAKNFGVYGAKKLHAQLRREGVGVARCTVEPLMRAAGLPGISRAKGTRTTIPGRGPDSRPDLVERNFTATGPNQLRVADTTYCRTFAGWVHAAFVIDVFSRRVVGWQASTSLRTDLALGALEMGIWTRQHSGHDISCLTHHSDEGLQYVAVRYTERLAKAGAVASAGSTGDSYDNALADAFNSLYKAELIRNRGPWKAIDDLPATADAALASLSQTRVDSRHNCYSDDGVSTHQRRRSVHLVRLVLSAR